MDFLDSLFGRKNDPVSRAIDEAIQLYATGDYQEGMAVLRDKALTRDPDHRRARLHLGVGLMLAGRLDEAEEILRPLALGKTLDSDTAMAGIALDRVERLRREAADG